jgi:hypothetical protein
MSEPGTVTAQLEELARRGFDANFGVVGDGVQVMNGGKTFKAEELAIREYYRLEGVSDPDDVSIVYAIESRDGTRGVLVDAFGVYANPAVGTALRDVRILRQGWFAHQRPRCPGRLDD